MPTVNGQQFPYSEEGIAQAQQAQGAGAPGGFAPDQNPFEAILNEGQGVPAGAPQGPEVPPEELPLELQQGKTGDNTKPLLSAIHNLHNYISQTTRDPAEIRVIRNLISALTQLVAKDQQRSLDGDVDVPTSAEVESPILAAANGRAQGPTATPTAA